MTSARTREPATASSPPPRRGNPWRPTLRGVALVTRIEVMRRRPSGRGWVVYVLLAAVILALGVTVSVLSPAGLTSTPLEIVLVMVLGAGMLIAPSLAATSINGDSSEGVLAPLQMTHLTAGDLAFGKLLASWLVCVAVLVTMTPFLVFGFARSGWQWHELLAVLAAIMLVVLVSTAIGLAWSSVAARAVASVSLAHLTTGALLLGTLALFFFTQPLVSESVTATSRYVDWEQLTQEEQEALDQAHRTGDYSEIDVEALACREESWEISVAHTERTAWLLLINPVVMIGETAPLVSVPSWEEEGRAAPGLFAQMHRAVSGAREGPREAAATGSNWDECAELAMQAASGEDGGAVMPDDPWAEEQEANSVHPRAPWLGLGIQAALLLASMWCVVRRLRVPYTTLRSGTRVA